MDKHIDSWIERAHSYPLSLVFRKLDGFLDPVDSVHPLITKHQWKSITLDSNDTTILLILKRLELSNLEMLESFSLATRFYNHNSKLSLKPPDALRYAPKLKTLGFYSENSVAFDTLPFPWRQLTSLTITLWGQINNSIGSDILQACVNLEEFIIDGDCDGRGDRKSVV